MTLTDYLEDVQQRYKKGSTLQDIADVYGVTRERVRQVLHKAGVSRQDGGGSLRARQKKAAAIAAQVGRAEAAARRRFGCSVRDLQMLGGWCSKVKDSIAGYYVQQRVNAAARGIRWQITLPEWWAIWEQSGRWEQRGNRRNSFVMCRFGDCGPYSSDNVYIDRMWRNSRDGKRGALQRRNPLTKGIAL
jgi:hypothetical protein